MEIQIRTRTISKDNKRKREEEWTSYFEYKQENANGFERIKVLKSKLGEIEALSPSARDFLFGGLFFFSIYFFFVFSFNL